MRTIVPADPCAEKGVDWVNAQAVVSDESPKELRAQNPE